MLFRSLVFATARIQPENLVNLPEIKPEFKNDKISNNSNEHKFSDILKKSMNNVKDKDSVDISDEGAVRELYGNKEIPNEYNL